MSESDDLTRARDHAVDLASRLDLNTSDVHDERALAAAIIDVRSHIRTRRGDVDWYARSGETRSISSEIYSAIHASTEEVDKLKRRLRQHFIAILQECVPSGNSEENVFTPDSFYDDLGVFITDMGRPSETSTEAVQLSAAAERLLDLIDIDAVREDGPVAIASAAAALQVVSDAALSIHKRLNNR
jgi:hypothetical protein